MIIDRQFVDLIVSEVNKLRNLGPILNELMDLKFSAPSVVEVTVIFDIDAKYRDFYANVCQFGGWIMPSPIGRSLIA